MHRLAAENLAIASRFYWAVAGAGVADTQLAEPITPSSKKPMFSIDGS